MKEIIEAQEKHHKDWQKLIFSGKILEDANTIASYNIEESDFLVLMVRKVRTATNVMNNFFTHLPFYLA